MIKILKNFINSLSFSIKISFTIFLVSIIVVVHSFYRINSILKERYIYKEKILTEEEKLKKLEKSFIKYRKMTGWDHIVNWRKNFKNVKYKLNGNIRYNELDCSGGIFIYVHFLGGNSDSNNSESVYQQMIRLKCRRKYKPKNIDPGDLIFFYRNGKIGHVGIVIECVGSKKLLVRYLDINKRSNGWAVKEVYYKNAKIYEPNFEWWVGEKLRKHLEKMKNET